MARRDLATNAKLFDAEIQIDSTDGRLRPGMTCACRIITGRIPGALFIPISSVFQKDGHAVVYTARARGFAEREVRPGLKNSLFIVIEKGLKEHERGALRDPTLPMDEAGRSGDREKASEELSPSGGSNQGFGPPPSGGP